MCNETNLCCKQVLPIPGRLISWRFQLKRREMCLSRFDGRHNPSHVGTYHKVYTCIGLGKFCSVFINCFLLQGSYCVALIHSPLSLIQSPSDLENRCFSCFTGLGSTSLNLKSLISTSLISTSLISSSFIPTYLILMSLISTSLILTSQISTILFSTSLNSTGLNSTSLNSARMSQTSSDLYNKPIGEITSQKNPYTTHGSY